MWTCRLDRGLVAMKFTVGIRSCAGAFVVAASLMASAASHAQAAPGITINTSAFQEMEVKADDGTVTRKLVPAARVVPGDEVVYEITYSNGGADSATNLAINNPVPDAVTFLVATNPPTAVSVDQGETFGNLGDLRVEGLDGQVRPAQPADITNLRWTIATLAPGAQGTIRYRVRVK